MGNPAEMSKEIYLTDQLQDFSIRKSKCFCMIISIRKLDLPCDRVVYKMLKIWSSTEGKDFLDSFDENRTILGLR